MYGVVIMAIVMLLVVPVGVMLGGAVWSALVGWLVEDDAETRYEGAPT